MLDKFHKVKTFALCEILACFVSFFYRQKNCIIYSGHNDRTYNFNPRILHEYALQKKICLEKGVEHLFVIRGVENNKQNSKKYNQKFLNPESFWDAVLIWRAKFWITASRPIFFNPLGLLRVRYINSWHGIPLKGIGLRDNYASILDRLRFRYYGQMAWRIVSPSRYFAPIFCDSFGVKKEKIIISGSPVIEFLLNPKLKIHEDLSLKSEGYNILYAPTYRTDDVLDHYLKIDVSFINELERLLSNQVQMYVRPHPLDEFFNSSVCEIISQDRVRELSYFYNRFDVIITDYSSVGVDAFIAGVPVILFHNDIKEYKSSRGFGVPQHIVSFTDVARNEIEVLELIEKKISKTRTPFLREPFHIEDISSCRVLFEHIGEYL